MWTMRTGRRITTADYRAIGQLEGIIEKRAEEVFKTFTPPQQELCRQLFLRLTEPGEGTEDTKRRVPWHELASSQPDVSGMADIVKSLADERLLTTSGTTVAADSVVEVAHETLIRRWCRLRDWIETDRAGLRIHRRLSESAAEWLKNNRDPGLLEYGTRLTLASEWADKHQAELSDSERGFLGADLAKRESERTEDELRRKRELQIAREREAEAEGRTADARAAAAKQKRLRNWAFLTAVVAVGFLATSLWQRSIANHERIRAVESEREAKNNSAQTYLLASRFAYREAKEGEFLHWSLRHIRRRRRVPRNNFSHKT